MNILLVCHVYPPEFAPAGIMVRELAEELTIRGNRVIVMTGWPNHPQGEIFAGWRAKFRCVEHDLTGFAVIRCGHSIHPRNKIHWRLWYYFTFALSTLINGMSIGSIDAVLCLSTPFFGTWSSWILSKIKHARFVYSIFDLHPEAARNSAIINENIIFKVLRVLDSEICRRSDVILALSESIKNSILIRGISPEHIRVAPIWVDTNKIRPALRDNPWRRKMGISPESFICLYAGTMGFISGIEMLVDTARRIIERKDILILCVGEGVAKINLKKKAAAYGLKNIIFFPFQPSDQLCDMLASADIGLVTLLPEAGKSSNPSKVLGYMAAGRPVLASVADDSDTASIIRAGKCGWVVPCQDSVAMADAICQAADNREETQNAGKRAREYSLSNFSREVCIDIYRRALEGN